MLAVQYPGRQERRLEAPVEDISGLAAILAGELAAAADRPFAFFGHSMGAVVAYETARRLREKSAPLPRHLFLSGRGAPSPEPRASDRLDGDAALIAEMRRLGGTAGAVFDDPELREMVLPAIRADYRRWPATRGCPVRP